MNTLLGPNSSIGVCFNKANILSRSIKVLLLLPFIKLVSLRGSFKIEVRSRVSSSPPKLYFNIYIINYLKPLL